MICRCCGKDKPKVVPRGSSNPLALNKQSRPHPPLCEACWADPALAYADCKHGEAKP